MAAFQAVLVDGPKVATLASLLPLVAQVGVHLN